MSNVTIKTINETFNNIDLTVNSINPVFKYDDLAEQFIILCEQINTFIDSNPEESEEIWYIGENCYSLLADMLVAAYWHYSEWHGGQYSEAYAAYCAIGSIYSPNMSCKPEEDDPEYDCYVQLDAMAKAFYHS